MSNEGQLVVAYTLPHPIVVTGDVLGRDYPVRVNPDVDGTIHLPGLDVTDHAWATITDPAVAGAEGLMNELTGAGVQEAHFNRWAGVNHLDRRVPGESVVYLQAIVVTAACESGDASRIAETLPEELASWFARLSEWIEVLAVHPMVGVPDAVVRGQGLDVFHREGLGRPERVKFKRIITISRHGVEPLTPEVWVRALERTSGDAEAALEHRFLAAARAAYALNDFRRAVLDSATSVELALTRSLDAQLSSLPVEFRSALRGQVRMLGGLIEVLSKAGLLPLGVTKRDLVVGVSEVRNTAIHGGRQPGRGEATTAIELAAKVAVAVAPLR